MKKSIVLIMALVMILSSVLLSGCSAEENNKADNSVNTASSYEDAVAQMADIIAGKGTPAMLKASMPEAFWNKCVENYDGTLDELLEGFIETVSGGILALGREEGTVKELKIEIIDPQPISSSELAQMREKMSTRHGVDYAEFTDGYTFAIVVETTVEDKDGNITTTDTRGESEEEARFGTVKVDGKWHMIMHTSFNVELSTKEWMLEEIVQEYIYSTDHDYVKEAKSEVAKSSYSAVMETVNGYMTIKGEFPITITEQTTIEQVMDALVAGGLDVVADNIDHSKLFLDYCELSNGYYHMRTLSTDELFELYAE